MTTKTRMAAIAMTAVAATAAANVIPALTGAQTTQGRQITVRMKVIAGAQVQHRRKGHMLATGDSILVRLKMTSPAGAGLGTAYSECVNVGPRARGEQALLQCTQTYKFNDGQIVTAGVVKFSQLKSLSIPIVGGSGAYRGASGHLTDGPPVRGFDSVDILHLDS
jgi:hypothetical protein